MRLVQQPLLACIYSRRISVLATVDIHQVIQPTTNRRTLLTTAGAGMAVSAMMQTLLGNATPRIVDELAAPELYD